MIRVVLRHIDALYGDLVGDFPPDQINDVVELLRVVRVHDSGQLGEADDLRLFEPMPATGSLQWIRTDEARPRWILEVIMEDDCE